ncbi:hypothetical protein COLO4_25554 [Corchorus olitorius]|uniref:Peptidase S8/S53 domain-containing protein n=1 Tax=Corchorus olitorius TaxID=93759 RepID=A0A1R3I1N2_9ROSI|nr:hypothetical protein COLO4_25554 [Corchorus olitorius]
MAVRISLLPWLMLICFTGFMLVYIVYMGDLPKGELSASTLHTKMLQEVVPSSPSDALLYSYQRSFNGFAAKLTEQEAEKLRGKEEVVSVFLSKKKKLLTSRSWDFMGFPIKKVRRSTMESEIIVGMLDSGIWPESESFNDTGFGPIPNKWKGSCQTSSNFTCNKKIIGAKYYRAIGQFGPHDLKSPRDRGGHGTHTASTAAGGLVSQTSFYGLAKGTVRGAVPSARIAVYKICWHDGCYDEDILAAFDDAIADGVDIISLSVGNLEASDYFEDSIAIGAFHSMKNGILTSNAAGNEGPSLFSIINISPWSLSVAASTIDRNFATKVKLGNGAIFEGSSINTFDLKGKMYPMIWGGNAPNISSGATSEESRYCWPDSLNATLVKGKIVFCEDLESNASEAVDAGAVGAVFLYGQATDYAFSYPLPYANLNIDDGRIVLNYLNTTEDTTATIYKSDQNNQFAPYVVSFSSRGPNPITADILKPDLTAPGVDILAAWSPLNPPSFYQEDTRKVPYNIISGTSMSCPHATGSAAYVKSLHPTWSPAAIKSALMTTAFPMSSENNLESEFAYGAGHINPAQAAQPGLVYDAGEIDYVKFLCGQGYTPKNMQLITGSNSSCSAEINGTVWDLNYPSFALSTKVGKSITRVFHRTVTNVGSPMSSYKAIVNAPPGLIIQVQPSLLSFKSLGESQSFVVTVHAEIGNSMISGSLTWDDGWHKVLSRASRICNKNIVTAGFGKLLFCCHLAVYIVYMGDLPKGEFSAPSLHTKMVQEVVSSASPDILLYSYQRSFNGFAAKLTKEEAQKLKENEGVVSVFLSQKRQLHTTRSWDFMGFPVSKVKRSVIESDIVVGMIDTGIWPESESFDDTGFGPIPQKWKGSCQKASNFTCNKKIIGAKYYHAGGKIDPRYDFVSPRDNDGHGTHTTSTAAGGLVSHTSLYGLAEGIARGGVPSARIAVYKVCWSDGCSDLDLLAAFDDAIADGVDIISISIGLPFAIDYFDDVIAIGAFHSMKNGILTSNSAGNSGPIPFTVSNLSPWSLSVAASTIDRNFGTKVKLGNGEIYEGSSINTFDLEGKMYPFIWGGDAPDTSDDNTWDDSRFCAYGTLNKTLVKGKIVFCEAGDNDPFGPFAAGAVGVVFQDGQAKDYEFTYPLPLAKLNMEDGRIVLNYLNTTKDTTATIYKSDQENNQFAPYVVSFSSRGPNSITEDLLKPDLTAPGVNILAAWAPVDPLSGYEDDPRKVQYNIISGTSMACPHATGAAAYVKSLHPTWSAAAIKSAIMTTAMPMSAQNNIEREFAYGAGHINPARAAEPGLVYDAGEIDFVKFLCGQGYSPKMLQLITGSSNSCSAETNGNVWDLNYPSFALSTTPGNPVTGVFHRTVTNVGSEVSTYKAVINAPPGLSIQVQPSVLSFKSLGESQSFVVTVHAEVGNSMLSGSLTWDDGQHQVYIVYMGELPKGEFSASSLHNNMLEEVVPSGSSDVLLYSYQRSFNGFAAKLTKEEAEKLKGKEGVVSVFRSQKKQLHTTRSWDFMDFPINKVRRSAIESDIIVGMIDTGIWPESESFNDTGFGPIPQKWKGSCQKSSNFTCNKKIIGAKYYAADGVDPSTDFKSPRDSEGHGTHTASTVAGGLISHTSLYGFAKGTARGGVPSARIAVYKVCWDGDCGDVDILAAFDDAIADGVDIISISLGAGFAFEYMEDSIAIGAFHAMKNGILTSSSVGNSGPKAYSVANLSPWSLSVAASTLDRKFRTMVKLGNGAIFQGNSINPFDLNGKMYPLIWGGDAPDTSKGHTWEISRFCYEETLNKTLVKGKIVFCEFDEVNVEGGPLDVSGPLEAGAAGAIFQDGGEKDYAFNAPIPLLKLNIKNGRMVLNYLNTTEAPSATIYRSIQDNNQFAPYVVAFSSKGPNPITSDILKPDLTAPGVNILAAWSPASPVTSYPEDTRKVPYNIISGTSMACPHATATAAYVKSFHPTWSPAAIKSALMTTAFLMSSQNNIEQEFAYGAGHLNPARAAQPGLIYDAGEIDYIKVLCGQGYGSIKVQLITGSNISCSAETIGTVWDLNLPSFALSTTPGKPVTRVFQRTVTNVGSAVSTYQAVVNAPPGLIIQVQPSVLSFKSLGESQSFIVTVKAEVGDSMLSGSLTWDDGQFKVYIVYMGTLPKGEFSAPSLHNNMLQEVVTSGSSDILLYSYQRSFNGFAAKLTKMEAEIMKGKEGVVSVFRSQKKQLHTTRSWDFMGFPIKKVKRSVMESDIIVGMLDTGIWPESESFNDTGFGPIPQKWKGSCQKSSNFTCNKKIIGAKFYHGGGDIDPSEFKSPRDSEGHGTHTASTVAGGLVSHASLYGYAKGTARGGVPSARIAVYKICWYGGCADIDILAAFDDAIADGVDIISLSIGASSASEYFEDSIAIGAFHSMKNAILTSNSAGNDGPIPFSVSNLSPWSLSVAASTIDRKFRTKVKLGNGAIYEGYSINTFDLEGKMYPFIWGGDAPDVSQGATWEDSRYCFEDSLDATLVKGKIVFCEYGGDIVGPLGAGAVGAVFQDGGFKDYGFTSPQPSSLLNMEDGIMVLNYLNTTEDTTATIYKSNQENNQFAPYVVSFSSRGPNPITPDILKPDLTAPGVDILAAWSQVSPMTIFAGDNRLVPYNIISGTSMSCPHATGSAAYVKSFHPTWSPAAINAQNNIEEEFAYGAGHINPAGAAQPGLIYDAGEIDYVKFLCGQGYGSKKLQLITGSNNSCSAETNGTVWDLNYPSFALSTTAGKSITGIFHRTVTNVGSAMSSYKAIIKAPPGLEIQVQPSVLSFKSLGELQSFVVTVKAQVGNSMLSGSLTWDDGQYKVRSPVVAYANLIK